MFSVMSSERARERRELSPNGKGSSFAFKNNDAEVSSRFLHWNVHYFTLSKNSQNKLPLTIFSADPLRSARSAAEPDRSFELSFAHELQQEQAPASAKFEHILT